mmetsp:Transcript_124358/g.264981  ORF Transcript_124358/g.264981 Transcript_124358/m.264981 type:complete len:272 (+) Transcript_124358:59-874(+)
MDSAKQPLRGTSRTVEPDFAFGGWAKGGAICKRKTGPHGGSPRRRPEWRVVGIATQRSQKEWRAPPEVAKVMGRDGRTRLRGVRSTSDISRYMKDVDPYSRKSWSVREAYKVMGLRRRPTKATRAWEALHSWYASEKPLDEWSRCELRKSDPALKKDLPEQVGLSVRLPCPEPIAEESDEAEANIEHETQDAARSARLLHAAAVKKRFEEIGGNNPNRMLDIIKLKEVLRKGGAEVTDLELEALVLAVDPHHQGKLIFGDFVDFLWPDRLE